MYGHELIDSLSLISDDNGVRDALISEIKNATHFFMGKSEDIKQLALSSFIKRTKDGQNFSAFNGEMGLYVYLPFDETCFFYDSNKVNGRLCKICICAKFNKKNNELSFNVYIFAPGANGVFCWGGNFIKYIITNFGQQEESEVFYSPLYEKFLNSNSEKQAIEVIMLLNATLMLLNTKNIITQDNKPPVKLNKKRIQKGKQPLFAYYTLKLQLSGIGKKNAGSSTPEGNTTRLHLCRGHFKTYTEDKPLLGSRIGRYWWQPQARGNKDNGVVMKDYEVNTATVKQ